jgi:hypothetical protein
VPHGQSPQGFLIVVVVKVDVTLGS